MKKKLIILISCLLLVFLIVLFFINNKEKKVFYLNDKYYNNSSLIEIDSVKLKNLEKEKESFIVFVYQPYCTTSYIFNDNIKQFSNEYKISFYKYLFTDIKDTSIEKKVKYCPSAVIYKEGKIVAHLDSSSDKDTLHYETVDGFKEWFTKYIILK